MDPSTPSSCAKRNHGGKVSVEIIAIGSEILKGFTINSNAAFISKELFKIGISTTRHTVLPDSEQPLKEGIYKALSRSDLIICTGGLGPTTDDLTRQWLAEIFDAQLVFKEDIAKELTERYGAGLLSLVNQSTVPDKATVISNPLGTAPGLLFTEGQKKIYLLPGVPYEMEEMMKAHVIPSLQKESYIDSELCYQWLHFFDLRESQVDPHLRILSEKYPEIEFGIYPARGKISIYAALRSKDKEKAQKTLKDAFQQLKDQFKQFEYKSSDGTLETAVQELFIPSNLTLSCAESCTGGAIASRLTSLANSSKYFLGSMVTYSNDLKENLLHVSNETLFTYGAVSQETVDEMIKGLMKITHSSFAIAVTGVAGPAGGTLEKPVGTVWAAIQAKGEEPIIWNIQAKGNRQMVIDYCVNIILGKLYHYVLEKQHCHIKN